ncbi:MAG: methionine--tRNA ligase [Chloroflexota bacterium]|nr:methionine--tRNA ligase [Chloroflexota bacterium]MDE3102353.1 methionine--tRNA ligase [Chloroflexota bacterium]
MPDRKFYLTTAIVYVNDAPGLHYLYEQIGTDVLARFHRQRGDDVFFLTGTDENATKIDRAARAKGEDTRAFVDGLAAKYQRAASVYGISYDRFIRTTDPDHVEGVQWFVRRWIENGDIYESTYEGLYCVSCEAFYEEGDLVEGRCPFHGDRDTIERLKEKNYFFRLSKYQKALEDLYRTQPGFCEPEIRRNEVLGWLARGLKDISVSRRGLKWGIPWPDDPQQTVYVWFDALINYVTGVGLGTNEQLFSRYWPADVHVIGKDISRFHCIYWPAMLLAAGIELPKQVWVHGFLNYGGQRLSKTSGNMIDPFAAAEEWGADAVRYLLLRQVGFSGDGDVSPEIFNARFDADLANGLGNLVARTAAMVERYFEGRVPGATAGGASEATVRTIAETALEKHDAAAAQLHFADALDSVFALVDAANKHYTVTQPWILARDAARRGDLAAALYTGCESLRLIAYLLWPYMPTAAAKIAEQLSVAAPAEVAWTDVARWGLLRSGTEVRQRPALFPRLESNKVA